MGAGETVLVAEDDRVVRDLVSRMLAMEGLKVLAADTPGRALDLAAGHPGSIDLLLTDVIMPAMYGPELARRLREARPGMRVIYMSGFTDHVSLREEVAAGRAIFLQKPFTVETLRERVAQALGSAGG